MLILKRKVGEIIELSDLLTGMTAEIHVVEVDQSGARIGLQIPDNVVAVRKEVSDNAKKHLMDAGARRLELASGHESDES